VQPRQTQYIYKTQKIDTETKTYGNIKTPENFAKPSYVLIICGIPNKFPTKSIFHILYKVESREPA